MIANYYQGTFTIIQRNLGGFLHYKDIIQHPHEFSDNFSDMDGFQDGGYICAQGVLSSMSTMHLLLLCVKCLMCADLYLQNLHFEYFPKMK